MSATKNLVDSFGRSRQENADRMAIMEAANLEARENWQDPQWRAEFAAELTESILLGFNYENLLDRFIETERTDFNGRIFVRESTGLKAFWTARGGYIEASQLTSEITEMPRDMVGIHVAEFTDKFLTNFAESANTLRQLALRRLDAEVNRRIMTVIAEAIPAGSPYFLSTPGLSKPGLDAAISAVRDASETGTVAIIGRPTMIDQISAFDGFGNETLEEVRAKGVLGTYRGATIVGLRNYKDEDNVPYFPANQLYVTATDVGKVAFYGGLLSKDFEELDNWYWHYLTRMDSGVMIHHPERARRLLDSSLSA